jgi:hypothetical protein
MSQDLNIIMKATEYAYLAGAIDADGYITIKRNTYSVRVIKDAKNPSYSERIGLKQVSDIVPKLILNNYGGYYSISKPNTPNGKRLHSIDITHKKAIAFLKDISPYLKIKTRQAEILFELRSIKEQPRDETHTTIQKNCWGREMPFKKHSISHERIELCESLIAELDTLNDIRQCKFAKTKEWRL